MYGSTKISPSLYKAAMDPKNMRISGFQPRGQPSFIIWDDTGLVTKNPYKTEERKGAKTTESPITGTFLIGLTSGKGRGKKQKFKPDTIRECVMDAFPNGGSAILQFGWYDGNAEDSLRFSVENVRIQGRRGIANETFKRRFEKLVNKLADTFRQNEVWYEFYIKGELDGTPMAVRWSDEKT